MLFQIQKAHYNYLSFNSIKKKFRCLEGEVWEEIVTKMVRDFFLVCKIMSHFDFCFLCP